MKILYIIQCLNHGGMETSLFNILEHLSPSHVILVCSLHEPTAARKLQLQRLGVLYLSLGYGPLKGFCSIFQIIKAIRSFSPDAIFSVGHSIAVTIALSSVRGRSIYKEQNIHFHHRGVRPYLFWFIYYFIACRVYNHITFPSDPNRLEASSYILSRYRNKICTQYNIINIPASSARFSSYFTKSSFCENIRFGFAGWLIQRKRPDLFIDFAYKIHSIFPNAKFVVAGEGPLLAGLMKKVSALVLEDSFQFLGVVADMQYFFDQIDCLCFFSDADAAALVPFEAFANRKLVISSTKAYGLQNFLQDGVNCVNVTNHSIDQLVEKFLSYSSIYNLLIDSGYQITSATFAPSTFFKTLTARSSLPFSDYEPLR